MKELIARFLEDHPEVPKFTAKDMRRSLTMLSGDAGMSKDIRDRLQNHSRRDVSSTHYDRWSCLPEKRAGMATWNEYLARILTGETTEIGQRESNVVPITRAI